MVDREKVIKGLECCIDPLKARCPECPYYPCYDQDTTSEQLLADALELLKEQEPVRCKDCKIRGNINLCPIVYIEKTEQFTALCTDDWFCADGERR